MSVEEVQEEVRGERVVPVFVLIERRRVGAQGFDEPSPSAPAPPLVEHVIAE
jgi:hypothetical protein